MEVQYPYYTLPTSQSYVFFPPSSQQELLHNDANHTLMIIQEMEVWANTNYISPWEWEPRYGWNPLPQAYNVYIRVHNFPLDFSHPRYFHLLTAGFGQALFVDDDINRGLDRSTLRMMVRCYDPNAVPRTVVIHHEQLWTKCHFTVLGWEFGGGTPPEGYDGPNSRGIRGIGDWRTEPHIYSPGEDYGLRQELTDVHRRIELARTGSGEDISVYWERIGKEDTRSMKENGSSSARAQSRTLQNPRTLRTAQCQMAGGLPTERAMEISIKRLMVKTDPFHCEWVNFNRIQCLCRWASRRLHKNNRMKRVTKNPVP